MSTAIRALVAARGSQTILPFFVSMLAACDATLDVEGMTKVDDESTSLAYLGGVSQESVCGDGHVDVDEECDDSNGTESDGCNADCTVTRVVQAALG